MAGLQRCQERRRNRRHARSGHDRGFRALKCRDFLFRDGQRGIAIPSVDVRLVLPFGPLLHFFRIGKGERRGANNLRDDRAVHTVAFRFTAMNGLGLRTKPA